VLDTLRSVIRFRPIELDSTTRRLQRAASVEDLRAIARRRLPGGVFDYIDGAAEDERALRRNSEAFARLGLAPRVLRDVSAIDTTTDLFGRTLPLPLVLSPTGFSRIADPQGELAVARAAERAGLPYTLSTMGTRSIEEVRSVSGGDLWFQVYVWRDRGLVLEMLERAAAAGYSTIAVTVDTAVLGRRERDVRRGFTLPPKIGLDTIVDGIRNPSWTWSFVRSEPIRFANVRSGADDGSNTAVNLSQYINSQFDPSLSWDDIDWFRSHWNGKVVVKGIQSVDDARIAVEHGVDGIALSNHGGRQLDGSRTAFDQLGEVVDAVGDRIDVMMDGGVQRGTHVVKALSMGAKAVGIGRGYLYALAAAGQPGVERALALFKAEIERDMKLMGVARVGDLSRANLRMSYPIR